MTEPFADLHQLLVHNPSQVVLIVGAGVSMSALQGTRQGKISSWAGLLRHGLGRSERHLDAASLARLREHLASDEAPRWIEAAEGITEALGGRDGLDFQQWLQDTVGKFAKAARRNDVLAAIADLAARGVILATVNYDGVLEELTGLEAVTWQDRAKVEAVIRGEQRGIIHLHGYWEEPSSLVLGGGSYTQVVGDEHARTVLKVLQMSKTMLLVGHGAGLQDPNWGSFLRWSEQIFSDSTHRHYRLARTSEVEDVRAEHPGAQRIEVMSYGDTRGDLGPFLASLVTGRARPNEAAAADACIVMRINVGEAHHRFVSYEEALAVADHPSPRCLSYDFGRHFDRETVTPRQWREIARGLDRLVEEAAKYSHGGARITIIGRAPLPVFGYLGARMYRDHERVSVANDFRGDGKWKLYGPAHVPNSAGTDHFETRYENFNEHARGKMAIALRSSTIHASRTASIIRAVEEEGHTLAAICDIFNETSSQRELPLTNAELPTLLRHFEAALVWRRQHTPDSAGLVFALACPNWVSYFSTNSMNPHAMGRVDFLNFDPTPGYLPALSLPMDKAPWVGLRPRLMVMSAEPADNARVEVGRIRRAIREAMTSEYKRSPIELEQIDSLAADDIIHEVEKFKPDILHFHLHASPDAIEVERSDGDGETLAVANFVARLQASAFEPAVIILTACHSASFAESLCGIAECVVAMVDDANTADAVRFSSEFYRSLARNNNLGRAITHGQLHAGAGTVVYFTETGIDPDGITLLPRQEGE